MNATRRTRLWALPIGSALLLGALAGCDFNAERVVPAEQQGGSYRGCAVSSGRCFFLSIYPASPPDGSFTGEGFVDVDDQPLEDPNIGFTLEGTRDGQRLTFTMYREGEVFGTFEGVGTAGWASFSGSLSGGELDGQRLELVRYTSGGSVGW